MQNIEIRRPRIEDTAELDRFFKLIITHTFAKEGIGELVEEIESEIEIKKNYLSRDIASNGKEIYFLIALKENKIIGTIAYGPASEMIISCTEGIFKNHGEIGTVYVHPDYQQQGIGNLLLKSMYETLQKQGIEEFCLDSGFPTAMKIWTKKFGEPTYRMKDYWGEGSDHLIWRVMIKDLILPSEMG